MAIGQRATLSRGHMDIHPLIPGKGMTELFLENMFIIMMRPVSVTELKLQNVSKVFVDKKQYKKVGNKAESYRF